MQLQIEKGYQDFIHGVSDGRDIPVPQVEALAQGRVWSGLAAKRLGLVDELGGEEQAIESAAKLAGLSPKAYKIDEMEPEGHLLSQAATQISLGHSSVDTLLRVVGMEAPIKMVAEHLRHFNDPRGMYAYCFCTPSSLGSASPR
jgi:protease-4